MTSIRQAMENRRAPFYLRRTKEAMVYFPERADDGEWVARKVFTKRIPHTVEFKIDGDEFELYAEVTRSSAGRARCRSPRRGHKGARGWLPHGDLSAPPRFIVLRAATFARKSGQPPH